MSFKKYNEMELAILASIATMDEEQMENICIENGDIDSIAMEEHTTPISRYAYKLSKSGISEDMLADINITSFRHAAERKKFFHKREQRKSRIKKLNYDVSDFSKREKGKLGEDNDILSAAHTDRTTLRGNKKDRKYMTVQKEMDLMEQENWEIARDSMEKEHDGILSSIGQDIDTLTLDLKSSEYSIENLEEEYKELEKAMKVVSEKLQNAKLRRNGIQAALAQKEEEYKETNDKLMQEMHRFGW